MTNYEWLKSLPMEQFVDMFTATDCPYCIENDFPHNHCGDCKEGILSWLQQEHIEPPKMVDANEIIKGIERAKYCDAKYCELAYATVCNGADKCINAIKNYIKTMEGVENETV